MKIIGTIKKRMNNSLARGVKPNLNEIKWPNSSINP
jgi:hypothetical protein